VKKKKEEIIDGDKGNGVPEKVKKKIRRKWKKKVVRVPRPRNRDVIV